MQENIEEKMIERNKVLLVEGIEFQVVDCLQKAFSTEVFLTVIGANNKEYLVPGELSHTKKTDQTETFYYSLIGSSFISAFIK